MPESTDTSWMLLPTGIVPGSTALPPTSEEARAKFDEWANGRCSGWDVSVTNVDEKPDMAEYWKAPNFKQWLPETSPDFPPSSRRN